jgi:hypothetical protein
MGHWYRGGNMKKNGKTKTRKPRTKVVINIFAGAREKYVWWPAIKKVV